MNELTDELVRLSQIKWEGYTKTKNLVGISYLGNVAHSTKMLHSYLHHISTYCIYLASANISGIEVCNPRYSQNCRENCLMGSGQNKVEKLSTNKKAYYIEKSRIIKTRLFFANKEVFMRLMLHEINVQRNKAMALGHEFSIRINATSDLNPMAFRYENKCILDLLPNIQFYDYTKIPTRIDLARKYPNYDITWSIDGSEENLAIGLKYLREGGRVAVVFGTDTFPKKWHGYDVIDGDAYDARYKDSNVVVGLKFKKTANNYINGHFVMPNTDFIVTEANPYCDW